MTCLLQTLKSTQAMADAMRGATKVRMRCGAKILFVVHKVLFALLHVC